MSASPVIHEIGIPVKSANWVRLYPGSGADGSPRVFATMGQDALPFFVLEIDPRDGSCSRHVADHPGARFPTASYWSERWGRLFIGVAYAGRLLSYDPAKEALIDHGTINEEGGATFPCRIDEAPDGKLFIGSYGSCDLTTFDPETDAFSPIGRMDETDMYFYPLCGADGSVAGVVKMTRPHVVVIDPATGEHRAVGPVADVDKQEGKVDLHKGEDGLLYVTSHEGDFRVEGMELVAVEEAPPAAPAPTLADGSTAAFADAAEFAYHKLRITAPDGGERTVPVDWEGDGTDAFLVRNGPDGMLYGSSILPEHLFRCDPATGECVDLGACSTSGGEAYSMAAFDGKLYIASYPAAKLSVYDPALPYSFGTEEGCNPREYGRFDEVAYRPYAMAAGPGGKVWAASVPDYGMWGGTLAWFDPATETFGSHRHIIQDCSPCALADVEGHGLLVGLSIEPGSGAQPRAERAGLILWDPEADAPKWTDDFGLKIHGVCGLLDAGNGQVYATIVELGEELRAGLFLLDLNTRTIVAQDYLGAERGWPLFLQSLFVHGEYVYCPTRLGMYRAKLGTATLEAYWITTEDDAVSSPGELVGDRWYFATGWRLRTMELPSAEG